LVVLLKYSQVGYLFLKVAEKLYFHFPSVGDLFTCVTSLLIGMFLTVSYLKPSAEFEIRSGLALETPNFSHTASLNAPYNFENKQP